MALPAGLGAARLALPAADGGAAARARTPWQPARGAKSAAREERVPEKRLRPPPRSHQREGSGSCRRARGALKEASGRMGKKRPRSRARRAAAAKGRGAPSHPPRSAAVVRSTLSNRTGPAPIGRAAGRGQGAPNGVGGAEMRKEGGGPRRDRLKHPGRRGGNARQQLLGCACLPAPARRRIYLPGRAPPLPGFPCPPPSHPTAVFAPRVRGAPRLPPLTAARVGRRVETGGRKVWIGACSGWRGAYKVIARKS